ncbi:hypothetical protein JCM8097_009358 [Rhodosporidiobolus ruineniae]
MSTQPEQRHRSVSSQLEEGARVPVTRLHSPSGPETTSDNGQLWLVCKSGGFKVDRDIATADGQGDQEPVHRDPVSLVESLVFNVDQSETAPSASITFSVLPNPAANRAQKSDISVDLALSHPEYDYLVVEKLKLILRGWCQASDGRIKAVISPQLALTPSDPRPPPKPQGFSPEASSTWVAPFPPPIAASSYDYADASDGEDGTPGATPSASTRKRARASSTSAGRRGNSVAAGSDEEKVVIGADGEPIFWNTTGRQRRKSTLGKKSYADQNTGESMFEESTDQAASPMTDPTASRQPARPRRSSPTASKKRKPTAASSSSAAASAAALTAAIAATLPTPAPVGAFQTHAGSLTPQISLSALPPLPPSSSGANAAAAHNGAGGYSYGSPSMSTNGLPAPSGTGYRASTAATAGQTDLEQRYDQLKLYSGQLAQLLLSLRTQVSNLEAIVGRPAGQLVYPGGVVTSGQNDVMQRLEALEKRCEGVERERDEERRERERLERVVDELARAGPNIEIGAPTMATVDGA